MPSPASRTARLPADAAPGSVRLQRFAMRGVKTALAGVVITACLWAMGPNGFGITLVYSLCISLTCWLLIDGSRLLVATRMPVALLGAASAGGRWPGWIWMLAIVGLGGLFGYAIGNEIANRLTGLHSPGPFSASGRQMASLIVLAVVPAIVITYFFQSREVIATQRAEVERAERQAAEQQLKLLESQLEPHMLFNTLANLRALIGIDPPRAQAMLDRLIAFLRASLAGSRAPTHPLAAEFERLRDYLSLMQVRMGDRLQTRFELPPVLADAEVPTLLLQPLVENAIKHGLEPKREGGRIDVVAMADGADLVIRVRDTGLGLRGALPISPETTSPSTPRTLSKEGGFGLEHIRERLATLHGDGRSRFDLRDADDAEGGTVATVRLPRAVPGAAS